MEHVSPKNETPADIRYPPLLRLPTHKTNASGLSHGIDKKLTSSAHGHSSAHGMTFSSFDDFLRLVRLIMANVQ